LLQRLHAFAYTKHFCCVHCLLHVYRSGYLLKPQWMTAGICSSGLPERAARTLRVTVYSAHVHQGKLMGIRKVSDWSLVGNC
jgi:hypothetical protein